MTKLRTRGADNWWFHCSNFLMWRLEKHWIFTFRSRSILWDLEWMKLLLFLHPCIKLHTVPVWNLSLKLKHMNHSCCCVMNLQVFHQLHRKDSIFNTLVKLLTHQKHRHSLQPLAALVEIRGDNLPHITLCILMQGFDDLSKDTSTCGPQGLVPGNHQTGADAEKSIDSRRQSHKNCVYLKAGFTPAEN